MPDQSASATAASVRPAVTRRLWSCLLILFILAGCADMVAPALQLTTASSAVAPAIGIDSFGRRHVVWAECPQRCTIQYERSAIGKPSVRIALVPPAGQTFGRPDVAVNSSGDAYLIWEQTSVGTPAQVTVSTALIPAGSTAVPTVQNITLPLSVVAGGDRPRLIARGSTVYATYVKASASGGQLYQRQIAPSWLAEVQLTNGLNTRPVVVALRIDSLDRLHLAYKLVTTDNGNHSVYYDGPTTAQQFLNGAAGVDTFSAPDLELDGADAAYVTYNELVATGNDRVTVFRRLDNGTTTTFQMLEPVSTPSWSVLFQPDAAVIGSALEISFTARHGTMGGDPHERALVWHGSLNLNTGAIQPPERISEPSVFFPYNPQIVDAEGFPAIVWQDRDPSSSAGPCEGNGYSWDIAHGVRLVHERTNIVGNCFVGQLDVAAANGWVAGVFIERNPARPSESAPWLAFNAYGTYIPRITK
jgi:hypothetical protein